MTNKEIELIERYSKGRVAVNSDVRKLCTEVRRLRRLLKEHGYHHDLCEFVTKEGGNCTCGWQKVLKELE